MDQSRPSTDNTIQESKKKADSSPNTRYENKMFSTKENNKLTPSEYAELVEADKRSILEKALKASLDDISRSMDKMNLSNSDADSGISIGSQKTFKEQYDSIFGNSDSDDEDEIDKSWEKIMKDAMEAFKLDKNYKPDLEYE